MLLNANGILKKKEVGDFLWLREHRNPTALKANFWHLIKWLLKIKLICFSVVSQLP